MGKWRKMQDFLFVNLEAQRKGAKPFDGIALGSFTDMRGRKVTFAKDDLPEYVQNTKANIAETADSRGVVVGLPIDQRGHYGDLDAAGWVVDVELSEGGDKIIFYPQWTPIGEDLIGNNLQRYFSPTVMTDEKVILGGSLTNWPATRGKKYKNLLKPVELSMSDETMQVDEDEVQPEADDTASKFDEFVSWLKRLLKLDKPEAEPEGGPAAEPVDEGVLSMPEPVEVVSPAVAELTEADAAKFEALIEERVNLRLGEKLAKMERENKVTTLSRELVGKGLPVEAEKLTAFLASLSLEQQEAAEGIFSRIVDTGLIPLAEVGHSQTMSGTQQLPSEMAALLRSWIGKGLSVEEFFTVNAVELGNQSDYNLSEFKKEAE